MTINFFSCEQNVLLLAFNVFRMSRYRESGLDVKVYVGDLPREASEKELERHFSYYGRLRSVWVARNPPGFAFIEFEDHRDADDAVRALDGGLVTHIS